MVGRGLAAPRRWRLRAAADEDPHWDDDAPAPAPEAPPPPEPFAEVKAAPPPPKPEFEDDSLASRCSAASVNFSGSYWHNSSSTREILTCFPLNWWKRSRGDDGSTRDKQEYIEIHKKERSCKKEAPTTSMTKQFSSFSSLSAFNRNKLRSGIRCKGVLQTKRLRFAWWLSLMRARQLSSQTKCCNWNKGKRIRGCIIIQLRLWQCWRNINGRRDES